MRDTSLRAITEVRGADWRGPHDQWAVIDATPLNRKFSVMPPPPSQAARRRASTRVTRGRMQLLAPAESSQPSSSQAPTAGEGRRCKRICTVRGSSFHYTQSSLLCYFICSGIRPHRSDPFLPQREREASTFVAFDPAVAAVVEAAGQAAGEEVGADVSDAQAK
ncbi:hypothetical protein RHMOL_Rhmol10G0146800 [Rhododendron molle]|uniref:Uncharacterized protein n=1 Tax=Rhododendron molle TaxID=49168 RepID=A0ACC0M3A5_RHOML|nr:hypothetical protein RHMOL_Rhmol10G0146800 [Rhododendron molle]